MQLYKHSSNHKIKMEFSLSMMTCGLPTFLDLMTYVESFLELSSNYYVLKYILHFLDVPGCGEDGCGEHVLFCLSVLNTSRSLSV